MKILGSVNNTATGDTENTTSNTSTTTTKKASIFVYVDGRQVKNESVAITNTNYTITYNTSGSKEVQITVGGNEVYRKTVNFSSGDQTIKISK